MSHLDHKEEVTENLISGSVLLAEDNVIVASETKAILEKMGAKEVFVTASEADSLSVLSENKITLAVLDIKLQSQDCTKLAEQCLASDTCFVFATGYGSHPFDIKRFGNVPIVVKPYGVRQLQSAIRAAILSASEHVARPA